MPHIHELIDFVVTPIILHPDKTKILLVLHPKYGQWMSVGGHVELDETPDQALLKEIEEETGLSVTVLSDKTPLKGDGYEVLWRPESVDMHDANPPHKHIALVYYCLANSAEYTISEEHTDMRWFNAEELDDNQYNISKLARYYAKDLLRRGHKMTEGK